MLKTLKPSEHKILFEKGFLQEYFKFIIDPANSKLMLMKIFGVYHITIGESKTVTFILTENMILVDAKLVKRYFDLKGSLYGRLTKISAT